MKQELQDKLFKKFKKILPQSKGSLPYGIECDDGWYEIIYNLCDQIQKYTNDKKCSQLVATQVKEKFGTLRFYFSFEDERISESEYQDVFNMIRDTECLSAKVCEATGGVGFLQKKGSWVKTLSKESGILLGYVPCQSLFD